jgi:hypothetical protein
MVTLTFQEFFLYRLYIFLKANINIKKKLLPLLMVAETLYHMQGNIQPSATSVDDSSIFDHTFHNNPGVKAKVTLSSKQFLVIII